MAENESGQERSESPTARQRQRAREEGQVARSAELSAATVLLAGAASLAMAGGATLATFARNVVRASAAALSAGALTPVGATHMIRTTVLGLVTALLPFALGVVAATVLVNLIQTRAAMSLKPIQPGFGKLNPVKGVQRLLSLDAVANLIKSVIKLAALSLVTWFVMRGNWPEMVSLCETSPAAILAVLCALGLRLLFLTGLAFLVVAGRTTHGRCSGSSSGCA